MNFDLRTLVFETADASGNDPTRVGGKSKIKVQRPKLYFKIE
jgi:hypothetical protein